MGIHSQYNLEFGKIKHNNWVEYRCYTNNIAYRRLAEKLRIMHPVECEGLIEDIELAESQQYFEEYFSLNRSGASDDEEIKIDPPNIIIDKVLSIPFNDMKLLLQEWLDFIRK
ncbi:hypothetical protein [Telluribacter sp.]|jgi:hypothetical protein|uniref:hypothetical protein n=1 Tax=Telluribacter sp. TaxID=1978767 RepID=UPI002E10E316|nr:hypothetical protein [Telluribacter sp.]